MFVVTKELIGVMGLPKTTKGIREILSRLTKNTPALVRKRQGTKAYAYYHACRSPNNIDGDQLITFNQIA